MVILVREGVFLKHIHKNNHRKTKPIVEIDSIDLVKRLASVNKVEIKLRGINKNYKIGVKKDYEGLFEKARGSTVVLDEIWALPQKVQQDIVSLLQHKLFSKVDSDSMQVLDVRVICTSTKDINILVQKGEFSEELYFFN